MSLSSSASWRTVVCIDRHHGTSPITSLQPSKLHRDSGYVPPTDSGSLCLAVDSTHTAVWLFRLLVRRSGTHCQMNSEIRRVMSTASNSSLKQSCSAVTSVTSALEVIFNVMRSIYPGFTYLLTYLLWMWLTHIYVRECERWKFSSSSQCATISRLRTQTNSALTHDSSRSKSWFNMYTYSTGCITISSCCLLA